jgi:hypothetical protein
MAAQIGLSIIQAAIAAGQSLSSEVDLGAQTLVGIAMPATWVAASLTFQFSVDGGTTWIEAYSSAGVETTFTVAAGQYIQIDPTTLRGVNALKVRSGTSASPVVQTGGASLSLIAKFVN